jgi:hypothetical protein
MTPRCIAASSLTSEAASCCCLIDPGQNSALRRHVVSFPECLPLPRLGPWVAATQPCPLTLYLLFHSSLPSAARTLKPSPIAATLQRSSPYPATTELPSLQPAPVTTAGHESHTGALPPLTPTTNRKRKSVTGNQHPETMTGSTGGVEVEACSTAPQATDEDAPAQEPKLKKSRTNTPWTPAEELRLKQMRDAGNSWSEIAKVRMHKPSRAILSDRK